MNDDLIRFPIKSFERTKNRRGKRSLSCIVSDRYLVFEKPDKKKPKSDTQFTPIFLDVMTETGGPDEPARKLCQLIITYENLIKVIKVVEDDFGP